MKELRGLIGSVQYAKTLLEFHHSPAALVDIIRQYTEFTRKNKFQPHPDIERIQKTLVDKIKPITLAFPYNANKLFIMTDASDIGVGAVIYKVPGNVSIQFDAS
jgi:hypothetical protein